MFKMEFIPGAGPGPHNSVPRDDECLNDEQIADWLRKTSAAKRPYMRYTCPRIDAYIQRAYDRKDVRTIKNYRSPARGIDWCGGAVLACDLEGFEKLQADGVRFLENERKRFKGPGRVYARVECSGIAAPTYGLCEYCSNLETDWRRKLGGQP